MRILVVDDEPLFVEFIQTYLSSLGFKDTVAANSGQTALETIDSATDKFDCFLLDIQMPEMDGIELCKRIRAKPEYTAAPILMITSMTESSYVDRAFLAGANDYFTKPIDKTEISARIGMVQALVSERENARTLLAELNNAPAHMTAQVKFEDSILLEDADFLIPFQSLENYLLRLGSFRIFSSVAIGFHVENAEQIFAKTDNQEFLDVMSEVAIAINECMHDAQTLLTYVGSGDFCAIKSRIKSINVEQLEMSVNDKICQNLEVVTGSDVGMPVVRVSHSVSHGLMSFADPTELIFEAVEAAATTKNSSRHIRKSQMKGTQNAQ